MTPKLPPPPANAPEELAVLAVAGMVQYAVSGDDVDRKEVVETKPVLAAQPAEAAGQGEAADARRRDQAAGRGEPMDLGLPVEIPPGGATLDSRAPGLRVHVDRRHAGEIDQKAAVAGATAAGVMATGAHRCDQPMLPRHVDGLDDIGGALAVRDDPRLLVEHAVPDQACGVIAFIAG